MLSEFVMNHTANSGSHATKYLGQTDLSISPYHLNLFQHDDFKLEALKEVQRRQYINQNIHDLEKLVDDEK